MGVLDQAYVQALPLLRFNKEGNLLAVPTADNGFKILANVSGLRSLKTVETPGFEALSSSIDSAAMQLRHLSLLLLMLVLLTVK